MQLNGLWFRGARYSIHVERGGGDTLVINGQVQPETIIRAPEQPGEYTVTVTVTGTATRNAP
jgi:hypothetical protein